MSIRVVTPPVLQPVSISLVQTDCSVDADDTELVSLLAANLEAATAHVEVMTGRALMTQTLELVLDGFSPAIELPRSPIQSVSSVSYFDTAGVLQTVGSENYAVDRVGEPGWIVPVTGFAWPETAQGINNVVIRFVAGWTAEALVPAPIRLAIRLLVADWFKNREATSADRLEQIPNGVTALLANYRLY